MPGHNPEYRLCFVNSMRSWGGAEVWMLDTALALRERGCAVDLVANCGSELQRRAKAAQLPVKALPIRIDGAPWTIAALAWHLRRRRCTAVVANRTKDVTVAAPAARLAGLDHILATRESDFPLKGRLDHRLHFRVLCTGVLVNSRATRRTVLDSAPWLNPGRVHLLCKGIDTDRFSPGPRPATPPTVGFAGQLIDRKGLPALMKAWSVVDATSRSPRPRLHLAGVGPLRNALEQWRENLQHPQAVELLGYVDDMPRFYRSLDLLVMPSTAEGFGLAAAEASACGVPVIAGKASSLPEIVADGVSGLLVTPGDSEALYQAMIRILDDSPWARRLGRAGCRLIRDRYPRDKSLARLLGLTGHSDYDTEGKPR